MKKKILKLSTALFLILTAVGCPDTTPPPPNLGEGFFIQTLFLPLAPPVIITAPSITTHWDYIQDVTGGDPPRGNTESFDNTTNLAGIGTSQDGRVPAKWLVTWNTPDPDPLCAGKQTQAQSDHPQRTVDILCFEEAIPADPGVTQGDTYTFTPAILYTDNSAGTTARISGPGFTAQYGMPMVRYFDNGGTLVNQASATTIASDGSSISAPMPDLSQVTPGSYVGAIYNLDSAGNLILLGTTAVNVLDPPILDNGGCTGTPRPINCN
jgi:hypothetical protein